MKQDFVKAIDFCDTHEINVNSLQVLKSSGKVPSYVFRMTSRKSGSRVDRIYFERRKDFTKKCWLAAHENFFKLTEDKSERELARLLNSIDPETSIQSWVVFLSQYLFSLQPKSILLFKVTKNLYKFLRYSNWILLRLSKC